jgi:hypothetical protein
MSEITIPRPAGVVPATSPAGLDLVNQIEKRVLETPQLKLITRHVIHAGVYSRTICVLKGTVMTSALIKVPTTVTICGDASMLVGDAREVRVKGYEVVAASAGRKVAYIAHEDTYITMSFKTNARSVHEAEAEFTDEHERLMSRRGVNEVVITGE